MKIFSTILFSIFLFSCGHKNVWHDSKYLDSLVRDTPHLDTLDLKGDSFIVSHTNIIDRDITVKNGYLKREDQITYMLKESATPASKYIIINSTDGLIPYDRIEICDNNNISGATAINAIIRISKDTLFLAHEIGHTFGEFWDYRAGTKMFKSINFFWVLSPIKYTYQNCTFENITFDGNRDNNSGTYFWDINAAVTAISSGITKYKNCTFINSPNETIVGHNADIRKCKFYNINGSAFHTVADRVFCPEDSIHSLIDSCVFENTNQVLRSMTGHSEGAITCSLSGGYFTVINSTFNHVGEAVIGGLYNSQNKNDWGTNNILFTKNKVYGDDNTRLVYSIDTTLQGQVRDVNISGNVLNKIKHWDYTKKYKGIKIEQ